MFRGYRPCRLALFLLVPCALPRWPSIITQTRSGAPWDALPVHRVPPFGWLRLLTDGSRPVPVPCGRASPCGWRIRAFVWIVEVPIVAAGTTSSYSSFTAYGVDGCRAGWLYVAIEPCGPIRWGVVPMLADLVRTVGDSDRILVDIPIGLPEGAEGRTCDWVARRRLGRRRNSVFSAPIRDVLGIDNFEDANRTSKATAGKGITKQTFAIVRKIQEVDSLLRRCSKARKLVREVHPEVCFWAFAGVITHASSEEGEGERGVPRACRCVEESASFRS